MRSDEARMLAALNGLIFGFIAVWIACTGTFGIVFAALAILSTCFWLCAWCAGRNEVRPLIACFVLTMGLFLWSLRGESFGLLQGGPVFLLIFAYLAIGVIVSVILHRETRKRPSPKRATPSLLERNRHG